MGGVFWRTTTCLLYTSNPQLASNPLSRWQQKQQIKKQYAAAKRAAQSGGSAAGAAQKTGKAAKTVKEKACLLYTSRCV